MEHYLEMAYAMMNQTMLNAILMEGIAVETVSTLTIAQNVIVMMKVHPHLIFHVSNYRIRVIATPS